MVSVRLCYGFINFINFFKISAVWLNLCIFHLDLVLLISFLIFFVSCHLSGLGLGLASCCLLSTLEKIIALFIRYLSRILRSFCFISFLCCMYGCLPACVSVHCYVPCSHGGQKRAHCHWSYKWLRGIIWVLGIRIRSSGRVVNELKGDVCRQPLPAVKCVRL